MCERRGLAVEAPAGTMLTARASNPARVATEISLCLFDAETTVPARDVVIPLFLMPLLQMGRVYWNGASPYTRRFE